MSWIKKTIMQSVSSSTMAGLQKNNPALFALIDWANEMPISKALVNYQVMREKLGLPPGKPINWLKYLDMLASTPITEVITMFCEKEFGIKDVADISIHGLLDSFTKVGPDNK